MNPWPTGWPFVSQYLLAIGLGMSLDILLCALASYVRDKRRCYR